MLPRRPDLSFGQFAFDPNSRLLRREGVEVPLPPRVLSILEVLLTRTGDVVPRQELIDTVWKDAFVTDTSLAEAISFLRQALGDDPQAPTYIQTVHRRGYRFVAPITVAEPPAPAPAEPVARAPALTETPPSGHEILAWSIALLSLLGAMSAMWYATRQAPVIPPVVQLSIAAGDGLTFDQRAPAIALSPTGDVVAWSACSATGCDLYVRSLNKDAVRKIDGTAGAAAPFFSPDGRWLGFFANGKLKKVLLQGGPASVIADAPQPGGAAWMRDGRIVFAGSMAGGLLRVAENGGGVDALTQPSAADGELRHVLPVAADSGDAITFIAVTSPLEPAAGRLVLLSYGNRRARVLRQTLVENVAAGALVGKEFVAYIKGRDLFAQPFDAGTQQTTGNEQIVATSVTAPHVALAGGALAVASSTGSDSDKGTGFAWSDPPHALLPHLPPLFDATLSPDGRTVAGIAAGTGGQLFTADLARGTTTRLTYGTPGASPVWSADGRELFFASEREGRYEIWSREANANGDERKRLATAERHVFPSSMSLSRLAYVETGGPTGADVGLLELSSGSARLVLTTRFDEAAPAISPDGERLAFQTDESGQWQVVLLDLRSGKRSAVSTAGGTRPFWSHDGTAVFFESDGALLRAIADADSGALSTPIAVRQLGSEHPVGITRTGALLLQWGPDTAPKTGLVTLQWIRELRALFGPPPVVLPR